MTYGKCEITYTSSNTFKDYENDKIKTIRRMKEYKEDCTMIDGGDGCVSYLKRAYDGAIDSTDTHWYEDLTVRTETIIVKETNKVVKKITYENMEWWGNDGKSKWYHRKIVETFVEGY